MAIIIMDDGRWLKKALWESVQFSFTSNAENILGEVRQNFSFFSAGNKLK